MKSTDVQRNTGRSRTCILLIFACILTISCTSTPSIELNPVTARSISSTLVKRVKQATIVINVNHEGGGTESGFGLIVGLTGNRVHAVTARHTLCPGEYKSTCDNGKLAYNSDVRLFEQPGSSVTAQTAYLNEALEPLARQLDLAHISFEVPESWTHPDLRIGANSVDLPVPDTKVVLVGQEQSWRVTRSPYLVDEREYDPTVGLDKIRFTGGPTHPGQSGAPLVSPDGVVGILLEGDSVNETNSALALNDIRNALKGAQIDWNIEPWRNDSTGASPTTSRSLWWLVAGVVGVVIWAIIESSGSSGDDGPTAPLIIIPTP